VLKPQGGLAPSGMALSYLHAHCPALVANLWDVTDGEIDRFTSALLESVTLRGGEDADKTVELLAAVAGARRACRLRFLTGARKVGQGSG
jgi:separase